MTVYVQAIKDAEADERIADQLAALQITLSQLAEHEAAVDGSTNVEADTAGGSKNHRSDSSDKVSCFCLVVILFQCNHVCGHAQMQVFAWNLLCQRLASMRDALLLDLLERKQCQSMTFTHEYTVQCQENVSRMAGQCCQTTAFHPVCCMLSLEVLSIGPLPLLRFSQLMSDTAQHSTAQHSTAQHSTAQHSTAQHSTAQRM